MSNACDVLRQTHHHEKLEKYNWISRTPPKAFVKIKGDQAALRASWVFSTQ